jgi:uncharacterized protein YoxC
MEQAADLNLILGIIFGLLSIFLVGFCITISFVVLSMRKSLDETDRRLEKILNKRLKEILLELKTLTEPIESQAAPIEEKSKNKRQKHRVTQIY